MICLARFVEHGGDTVDVEVVENARQRNPSNRKRDSKTWFYDLSQS